ncbi:hypothetical protein [Morganella morganii]|uniref:hypothetical protein n=1 Tax=Morganella morganii TaxID=582 RepID=UPI003EC0CBCF
MTVSTELSHEEYTGNGVTTDFDFRFRIFEAKHLVVSVADQDGTEHILTNGTDYTLRGVGSYRGGKVILKMPLATGWKIGIARDLPAVQETDLRNQGKFFAEVHEDAFDYLTMLIQKSLGFLSLCLRKPSFISDHYDAKSDKISNLGKPVKDSDAVDLGTMKEYVSAKDKRSLRVADKDIPVLPNVVNRANKLLSFDDNGNPVVIVPESGSAADVLAELAKPTGAELVGIKDGRRLDRFIETKCLINTIDEISKYSLLPGDLIYISKYSESCPAGGGLFKVVKKDEITDDGGINFIRGNSAITRIFDKKINVSFFGVYGDLPTNTERFQRTVDFAGNKYPLVIDGVFEIYGTVNIPRNCDISGLGHTESVRYGDYEEWSGLDLSFYKGKSLIIIGATSGAALRCEEGVKLKEFDIVSRLPDSAIGRKIDSVFSSDASSFSDTTAIEKNKYIKIDNVTISFVRTAIYDHTFNDNSGDYYTETNGFIINNSYRGMVYANASYNNKHLSIRMTNVAKPFECYKEANNWVFYGGAIEGYSSGSPFPGRSDVSFFGTYFETFFAGEVDHVFFATESARISFHDCLVYLNNTKSLVRTSALHPVSVSSYNSRFVLANGNKKNSVLLNVNDNNGLATMSSVGNKYMAESGFSIKEVLFEVRSFFGHDSFNNFRMGLTDGITMKILSSPPVDGRSGTMYCCDGSSWNPASKPGGLPYFVFYRDGFYLPLGGI